MGFDFGNILQQVVGGNSPALADIENHFLQATQGSDAGVISQGLAAMFHSDQTPPFAQMAGQLFGQANPDQQAGMLNHLLSAVPGGLSALAGGSGGSALANIVSQLAGSSSTVTPAQAALLTPDQMQKIVEIAHQNYPGIVEHMSDFYAQHAGLIKTLGSGALSLALAKMAESHQGS